MKERPFNSETFNQKCLDCQALLKASCRKIHLLILIRLFTIHPKAGIATQDLFPHLLPNRSARWCGNWTCHWTMSKSKKSLNLLIETRQDQHQHHFKLTGLRLLLLHNMYRTRSCYFTQLCFWSFPTVFSIPFNSRMASWPMRSIWSWWCWVFSVSSRQSRHQRGLKKCCHVGKSWNT